MKNNKILGSILLLCASLIWGSSFVFMKNAVDFITPFTVLWIRFSIAAMCMLVLFYRYLKQITKQQVLKGALTGLLLITAYMLQTYGLSLTTPAKNAFLTSVYCVMIPFFIWILYKEKPDNFQWVAAILCFIGVGFVSLAGSMVIEIGDILTLCSGCFYAFHIIAVKRYSETIHPIAMTTLQFVFAAIFSGIGSLVFEDILIVTQITNDISMQILYLAIFATTITLLCQNIGQQKVSACSASILLSLESVFGVIFSVALYGEQIRLQGWIGFLCIFFAIIISETKLSFLKKGRIE